MGTSTISMAIFNGYVNVYQRVHMAMENAWKMAENGGLIIGLVLLGKSEPETMGFSYEIWGFPAIFPLNSNNLSMKITELTGDVFGSAGMILRSRHSCEQVTEPPN